MSARDLFSPLTFARGPAMKNRIMLAPLTNKQSHEDGRLSDDEFRWLLMRAEGGFGLTMTAAATVQKSGQIEAGQLGIHSDIHIEGLARLASAIKAAGSLAVVQLHHGGMRANPVLIGLVPHCPSDNAEFKARGLSACEVEQLTEDFIAAAMRADRAGFDGVELHGAHGYILAQFLSAEINRRRDQWGGNFENRARLIDDVIKGIRARCRPDFQLGMRLTVERWGMKLGEMIAYSQQLMHRGELDYLDLSLWDFTKEPEEAEFKGRTLMSYFTELDRGRVRLGVCGHIRNGKAAARAISAGADFVLIGRAALVHHDWPARLRADQNFQPRDMPLSRDYLHGEGLADVFIDYMATVMPGFVEAKGEKSMEMDPLTGVRVGKSTR